MGREGNDRSRSHKKEENADKEQHTSSAVMPSSCPYSVYLHCKLCGLQHQKGQLRRLVTSFLLRTQNRHCHRLIPTAVPSSSSSSSLGKNATTHMGKNFEDSVSRDSHNPLVRVLQGSNSSLMGHHTLCAGEMFSHWSSLHLLLCG